MPPKKKPPAAKKAKPAKKAAGKAKAPKKPAGKPKGKKGADKAKKGGDKAKKGGAKGKKGAAKPVKDVPQAESGPANLPTTEAKKKRIDPSDLVIVVLWSFEIVHQFMQALRTSFTKDALTDGKLTKDIHAHRSSSVATMVFVTCITMTVGNYIADKPKFPALMTGLIIYMGTAVLGIFMLTPKPIGYAVVLILAQIGWHAVSPIRYWFIFHQSFPLSFKQSVSLVAFNQCLVGIAEFIGAVWIEQKLYGVRTYLFSWMSLSLAMTIWLGALLYLKVSNFMNNSPDDKEAVENIYKQTEVMNSFEARQKSKHWMYFVWLICPSMMFPAVKETVGMVVETELNPYRITYYRLDILFAIAIMPVASIGLIMIDQMRHEIRAMVLVGFAKFLNIVALILYLVVILNSPEQSDLPMTHVDSMQLSTAAAYVISNGRVKYYTDGDGGEYKTPEKNISVFVIKPTKNSILLPIKLYDSKKQLIASKEIELTPKKVTLYALFKNDIKPLVGVTKSVETYSNSSLYWLYNSCEPCPGEALTDQQGDPRIWVNNSCNSVQVVTLHLKRDFSVITEKIEKVPVSGEISEVNVIDEKAVEFSASVYLNDLETTNVGMHLIPSDIWTVFVIRSGDQREKPVVLEVFRLPLHVWQSVNFYTHEVPTTCVVTKPTEAPKPGEGSILSVVAMCVAGVAFGLSSVSYIHFVWIQCPYDYRMLILASFFTINYIGGWMARHLLAQVNFVMIVGLIVMQGVFWIWHITALVFFNGTLPPITEEEKSKRADRRF